MSCTYRIEVEIDGLKFQQKHRVCRFILFVTDLQNEKLEKLKSRCHIFVLLYSYVFFYFAAFRLHVTDQSIDLLTDQRASSVVVSWLVTYGCFSRFHEYVFKYENEYEY